MKHFNKYGVIIFVMFVFFMFYKPVICFLILGGIALFYGLYFFFFLSNIKKDGIETFGKILAYEKDNEGYKTPVVEFELEGKLIKEKPYYYASTDLSKFRTYNNNIDKPIAIIYSPKEPEKFILKSEKGFNYITLIFVFIVGLFFVFLSLAHIFDFIKIDGMN